MTIESNGNVITAYREEIPDGFVIPSGHFLIEKDTGGVKIGTSKTYAETKYVATAHECDDDTHRWHHPLLRHRWLRWISIGLFFHIGLEIVMHIIFHIGPVQGFFEDTGLVRDNHVGVEEVHEDHDHEEHHEEHDD